MAKLVWDKAGQRFYETGTDHGVMYRQNNTGAYDKGVVWNGLTTVTESPSGAESNPQYADNIKYVDLKSAEEFGFTIEAFYSPEEFDECDGSAKVNGVRLGQQTRKPFGFSWRTLVGNDLEGNDHAYKIHIAYGATAAPSEKAYNTVNDSPEAITLSWECTTTATAVGEVDGVEYKPTASLTIDSRDHTAANMLALEKLLYGDETSEAHLPAPAEIIALFANEVVTPPTGP